ncbi:MAG: HNH endonuclease [Myxococcota bacterium]
MDSGPTRDVLATPVLVLNKSYQPVRITSARNAFLLLYGDRAHALDSEYEPHDFVGWSELEPRAQDLSIRTPTGALRVPRLVLLRGYNRVPRTPLRLSRRNVFLRDGHACMYCGDTRELTIDHVLPRSRGGRSTWENLVACCRSCNLAKGRRTPEEAGMKLRAPAIRPTWTVVVQLSGVNEQLPDWEPFLAPLRDKRRRSTAA